MTPTIKESYGLLFHLMEYWEREKKAAQMAAVLRLESADREDPYTLVDLEHVKTLDSSNPANTSSRKWVQYRFPSQPHNP